MQRRRVCDSWPRWSGSIGLMLSAWACSDEFPTDPLIEFEIDPAASLTSTMMVRDTDTVVVRLIDSAAAAVKGIRVRWSSSAPALLELKPIAPATASPRDSLDAQMRIQTIAHARGNAVVTATVDQPGFAAVAFEHTATILERWVQVTSGAGYTCGLTIDQDAYCWGGMNTFVFPNLALGTGSTDGSDRPVPVLGGLKFTSLVAGDNITCGLTNLPGLLYCWGANTWGELGLGNFQPSLVPAITVGGRTYTQVSTRGTVTCAIASFATIDTDGARANTLCWGRATSGAMGRGSATAFDAVACTSVGFPGGVCVPQPTCCVFALVSRDFVLHSVGVGGEFACGLVENRNLLVRGEVYCWGLNTVGQTGLSPFGEEDANCATNPDLEPPIPCRVLADKVATDHAFTALSVGGGFSCAVATTKAVYCWGQRYGPTPTLVSGSGQVDSVSVGGRSDALLSEFLDLTHACALTVLGEAYCWGSNLAGQLGTGELDEFQTPTLFHTDMQKVAQDTLRFVAISAGESTEVIQGDVAHTCALTGEGAIYCWGSNLTGAVGVPGATVVMVPTRIAEPIP